jgi:hypothetical protein
VLAFEITRGLNRMKRTFSNAMVDYLVVFYCVTIDFQT